jgi:acyl-homoserine lactone acylase PvdQ
LRFRGGIWLIVLAGLAFAPAANAADPQPFGANDGRGFYNILPPGSNGLLNSADLATYVALGRRPAHSQDQLRMYEELVYATPGLTQARITDFFKDATFGVRANDLESTIKPRAGVTILRDKGFGVPRVYGTTRADTMFGAGYANAQDRLFFMDVLRNAGRSRLSSFAGGANKAMDEDTWSLAPYTEADLQRQYDEFDDQYGAEGGKAQSDVQAYADGINAYIQATKINPLLLPGEYVALGKPGGPQPWKVTDIVSTATLVGSIFGKGGGGELGNATAYQAAQRRFGRKRGAAVFRDMRSGEDAEAPVTARGKTFNSMATPRKIAEGSVALPDRGSLAMYNLIQGATGGGRNVSRAQAQSAVDGVIGSLRSLPRSMSNALLVSGRKSASGRPLAVFGPQTGYFAPQILWEVELHGPGVEARGAAFNGAGLYVTLGRGRDYAWSATSAGQDIIDTFAVDLCEPGGGAPSLASEHYRYNGQCVPFEKLSTTNHWQPNLADSTPEGTFTLQALRSRYGLVQARARVRGKPVAYTRLRSTYGHEFDAAIGISRFNDPNAIRSPQDFQRAAYNIGYTFHWFYADSKHIAYLNSGNDPVRAKGINPTFPVAAKYAWKGLDPGAYRASYTPIAKHPQTVDQSYIVNWNNKGARGYRAADSQ